ncbi:hypothetical protein B0T26DRAFT_657300 [Lasiosphaeria miniovina]|uniref:Ribosomal protein s17 n=1 Tax=Lasiosphaeria miniovina TaxID=1954250 RepID=A0AA40DH93_9PEZI|nr:uncharacterized protein B0T26DRAFT_657300 [Lasiosphaeria miniovina]KAK0703474.1 hypothetical protein B0T26DRAFT_657300 [Lasiosphaeria miniovina]
MLMKTTLAALLGLAVAAEAASVSQIRSPIAFERRQNNNNGKNNNNAKNNNNNNNQNNNNANAVTTLDPAVIQTGSQSTGQSGAVAADGQANSATDNANFINFCKGQTLTNGLQQKQGSCNGIVMGKIPANTKMVSTVITNPKNNDVVQENQTFNINLQIANLAAGSFTNATSTYYSAPQDLNGAGLIIGHTHVTVQDTGASLNPTTPLDAQQFVFFKGINDAGDGKGGLSAVVTGGLPAGNYRVCTMSSASNHQPVLMPVAQRGSQEDCRFFTVSANAGNGNANNNAGNANNNAGNANNNAGNANNTGNANNAGNANNNANAGKANNNANAGKANNNANAGKANNNAGKANNNAGKGNNAAATTTAAAAGKATATAAANAGAGKANAGAGKANAGAGKATAGGAIAGIAAPAVTDTGNADRKFAVNGDTFVNKAAAVQRACAIQNNACADAVNSGKAQGSSVSDCNAQEQACRTAGGA